MVFCYDLSFAISILRQNLLKYDSFLSSVLVFHAPKIFKTGWV
ncbi:hypothetical protein EJK55_0933 [Moraxella catarrhalis]|uniref:Uncharacterized protein n=1 Tax=Moraxella catarrhalis TaxID=480 RepID=A0A3Q9GCV0_MORCA|nr:hypothetical protein MCR_0274 [Moraxella catarrhalis BBH18]AZQ87342.1 hypothetical protein EJK52_0296 [Moraxella catarrhalis]EKF84537.1 hypothetical protein MCRH_0322 [Moraxella catarrhalis RH4]AZQ88855.1 hypothetical protein EJK50_0289 [Moraxella catarrhalis]AZQ91147.1 hypothetical protein EJK51_0295 [Moraxella catarrhalis]